MKQTAITYYNQVLKKGSIFFMQLLFVIWATMPKITFAQDLHFSQFFNSPLSTNPANTGFIPDADYRIGAHVRNQFSNVMVFPYKTISVFGDAQLLRDKFENGWMGLGFLLLSDEAGEGSLKSTKIYGSLAYHQMLGNSSLLSAGFNLGWANKSIKTNNLKFPDQFNGYFFDITLPTSVTFANTQVNYFDLQAGINYAYFPKDDVYLNVGYSIHHVNQPKESFFSNPTIGNTIPIRHIGFANAMLKLNKSLILQPSIYYSNQASASQVVIGLSTRINLISGGETQFISGVYYRNKDAIIPLLGFQIKSIQFNFSYDATVSTLKSYNKSMGAGEISLIKKGFYPNTPYRQALCPSF
ncbi:MAG: PorP/SprF family type IX secretion system membrane protein [Sphingobacteriales bacterium]|nr:PorP/SprF family type IX secretion system membrane protein [Sphingobacteriales bacterium]